MLSNDIIVSLVVPMGPNDSRHFAIMLQTLEHQTAKKFEVIGVVDGGDEEKIRKQAKDLNLSFPCRVIKSPRLSRTDLPHRNHARNAGCKVAKSPLIWIIDVDQIISSNAIEQIGKEQKKDLKNKTPSIYVIPLFDVSLSPRQWVSYYKDWEKSKKSIQSLFDSVKKDGAGFGRLGKYYRENGDTVNIKKIQENMPIIPNQLFEALKGFDESFLGWGGNKHEFCTRLEALAQKEIITMKIIKSARLLHQAHIQDKTKTNKKHREKNSRKLNTKKKDMKNNAPWWIDQVNNAKKTIDSVFGNFTTIVIPDMCSEIYKELGDADVIAINSTLRKPHDNLTLLRTAPHLTEMDQLALAIPYAESGRLVIVRPGKRPSAEEILSATTTTSNVICISKYRLAELGNYPSYISTFDDLAQVLSDGTQFLSSTPYRQRLPEISAFRPAILKRKPKISLGIITFNRKGILKKALDSLRESMRPDLFEYDVFIVDDGSTDGTVEFLKGQEFPWEAFKRGGVHRQSNRILKHFNGNVEYGFLCNDDLTYKEGWEEAYIAAMKHTPYEHIVYMDHGFENKLRSGSLKTPQDIKIFDGVPLVCWRTNRIQGVLLTFTQKSIDKIGGMDAANLGLCGHGHVDYTLRNIKAGMAPGSKSTSTGVYDVMGSNNVLRLTLAPHAAPGRPGSQKSASYFNKVKNKTGRIKVGMVT